MQRRKVDLPEPDGPTRHITSPRSTVSEMPLSTRSAPKFLHTSSLRTIGSAHQMSPFWLPAPWASASACSCRTDILRDAPRAK